MCRVSGAKELNIRTSYLDTQVHAIRNEENSKKTEIVEHIEP